MRVQVTDVYGQVVIHSAVELADIVSDPGVQVEASADLTAFGEYLITGTGGGLWLLKDESYDPAA